MATGEEGLAAGRAGASTGKSDRGLSNPVLLALIWLCGASATLLLLLGSKLTFLLDDWEFLVYRRGFNADAILEPHGEHIVVLPILIYKALLATVGMGSALPFRVVSTGLFLLSAALLFVYLWRRVGQWPALAATAIVLFLGAAWEDLLWSFQMGFFGGMAAGLGGLLALERGDRRGEMLACLLLVVSILFSSLGLSFAIGAAVHVLLGPERRRRLYVFLVPLAVYAIWWLGWGHTAESALSLTNVAKTPLYVLNGFAASIASALGLAHHGLSGSRLNWVRPIAVALIFLVCWRLYRLGRTPHWFWVALAIGGSFWILAGFNQMLGRAPESSRYQYVGVVFLFMVGAEFLRVELEQGLQFGTKTLAAIGVVAVLSIASNVESLVNAWDKGYHPISQLEKADLGALEIAEGTVEPSFVLSEDIADTGYVHIEAGPYLSARDAFGSPAYDEAEIAASPDFVRFAADKVLFGALRMGLEALPGGTAPSRAPLAPRPSPGEAIVVPSRGCVEVPGEGSRSPLLSLPRNGVLIRAGNRPIERFGLSRFAAAGQFPILIDGIGAGEARRLAIPPDKASTHWKMQLQATAPSVACGLGGGAG